MNKKAIVIATVLFALFVTGTVFAQNVCRVLDVNGNQTTDTINVSVYSCDSTTGKVFVAVSSDSDKPVNATITISHYGNAKSWPVRIEPFQSGTKEFTFGTFHTNDATKFTVGVSGAKCLR